MINLVVCGLEDTLLKNSDTISEETLALIGRLKDKGVRFAVASNRNYNAIKDLFGTIHKDIIYICNDGGVIYNDDQIISKSKLDRLVILDVVNEVEKDEYKRLIDLIYADDKDSYITTFDHEFEEYVKDQGMNPVYIKDNKEIAHNVSKITLCARDGFDEKLYSHFYLRWAEKANVAITDKYQAFVTAPMVSKGTAIALLQHLFETSEEDTVVFGGSYSDIDMFSHCFYSYAMQSSDLQVRRSAKHIAENVDTILEDIMRM